MSSGAWVKVMNTLRSHPKALSVSDTAFRLYVCSLLYANEHLTDGRIPHHVLDAVAPGLKRVQRAKDELLRAELWELGDGFWTVHDYLAVQSSAEAIRRNRVATADRVRRHRGRNAVTNADVTRPCNADVRKEEEEEETEEEQKGITSSLRSDVVEPSGIDGRRIVRELFEYWQARCGHPKALFSADRQRKIGARLREGHTPDRIRQAIDGAALNAFVNDDGTRFDDIELICRNTAKVKLFMDRATSGPRVGTLSNAEFAEAMNAGR